VPLLPFLVLQTVQSQTSNLDVSSSQNQKLTQLLKPSEMRFALMKTLSKSLTTASRLLTDYDSKYLFTASEVLGLFLQVRELRDYRIGLTEIFDGGLQFTIGNSVYQIFQSSDEDTP
jgi:hypothetical protein